MRSPKTQGPLIALAAVATTLGIGCGGVVPSPTAADAAWASTQGWRTTVAGLAEGRALYVARCSGCHALRPPTPPPPEGWARAVAHMAPRARLEAPQARLVTAYLEATSRPGRRGEHATASSAHATPPPEEEPAPHGSPEDDARGWSTGL